MWARRCPLLQIMVLGNLQFIFIYLFLPRGVLSWYGPLSNEGQCTLILRTNSHRVPSPTSQVTWGQSILAIESMGVGTYHFSWVPSPKSQVWHRCLHDNTFWRRGLGHVLKVGSSRALNPTLNKAVWISLHKIIKSRLQWLFIIIEWCLEAQKLGLRLRVGTWD